VGPHLDWINKSLSEFGTEVILCCGILFLLVTGLIKKYKHTSGIIALIILIGSLISVVVAFGSTPLIRIFHGMAQNNDVILCFKLLFIVGGILTVLMSLRDKHAPFRSEYYLLITAIVLGANLLAMSTNFIMTFISLEVISISSYVLAGFAFNKKSAEGSLKYFLFGSVASAIMLYGFSILYGVTGTVDLFGDDLVASLTQHHTPIVIIGAFMVLAGFLFKIVAVPMHPWSPDVYESAPIPVIALFSVVPKLAGLIVFIRFSGALTSIESDLLDWRQVIGIIALLTITVGNFSALIQKNAKRMMAYSSIAQAGFLLIGAYANDVPFVIFYSAVYLIMNYVVFLCLQYFERCGIDSIERFSGIGKSMLFPSIILIVGLIALTGLPPTGGFTAKLFIFTSLWKSYEVWGKNFSIVLLFFGLLNTVISLFFYLKIPYYAFLKTGEPIQKQNILTFENLLALFLVLILLALFFQPGLLMGRIIDLSL
jgi:NADH-quinone oxidoreductase subunit N